MYISPDQEYWSIEFNSLISMSILHVIRIAPFKPALLLYMSSISLSEPDENVLIHSSNIMAVQCQL